MTTADKFTFRRHDSRGGTFVVLYGHPVGFIEPPSWKSGGEWKIALSVSTDLVHGTLHVRETFPSDMAARRWLQAHRNQLASVGLSPFAD